MPRQYLLVDFENVQPANLGALKPGEWDIRVFLGQHQTRLEFGLVQAVQAFGANAQYIQIVGNGKDALDFHIAFYIGRLSIEEPGSSFVIVSRDTGFDPLIKHLDKLGIACKRVATIPGAAVRLPTATKAAKRVAPRETRGPDETRGASETRSASETRRQDHAHAGQESCRRQEGARRATTPAGSRRPPAWHEACPPAHGEDLAFVARELQPAVRRRRHRRDVAGPASHGRAAGRRHEDRLRRPGLKLSRASRARR